MMMRIAYAVETWTFSKADRNGIEAFEVWIWRRILPMSKISWKTVTMR